MRLLKVGGLCLVGKMFGGNVLKRMEKQFISTTKVTKNGESEGDFTC